MRTSRILIGIDLEELSLPAVAGQQCSLEERLQVTYNGLERALTILDRYQARATFFITAAWARAYPGMVRQLAGRHEVAAYGYMEKEVLEQVTGSRVYGCRQVVGTSPDYGALKAAGYLYHSGGGEVRPMTIAGQVYEIYAGVLHPLWITRFFARRQAVINLRMSSWELCGYPNSRVPGPRLAVRLDSVLKYLQRKGQFMPHIEWLQEQLTDE